jgi:hypothetical protein
LRIVEGYVFYPSTAAEALTEAFAEFLFPDAADVDEPQA